MPSYGAWPSPLTAARVAAGALRLDQIQIDSNPTTQSPHRGEPGGGDVYWLEGRSSEGGRNVIVRWTSTGIVDVTPQGFNARSRVHEYGGAAYTVHNGAVYFTNFSDQRVYRQALGESPVPMTEPGAMWADYRVDAARHRLIGVREQNGINTIAAIPERTLIEGADFYSDPIVSPDGKFLAWLQWHHPNMPWDGTELWVAAFNASGLIGVREKVAGGPNESIFQPEWSPDGALYFVSDRTGWWNLYRWAGTDVEAIHPMATEFGKPQWTFSMVTYAFVAANRIAATYVERGEWKLALINPVLKTFQPVALATQPLESIKANGSDIYFIGGSATQAAAVVCLRAADSGDRATIEVLRRSTTEEIGEEWISKPEALTYTVKDRDVHAFYYPPTNPDVTPPPHERPPLLVITHGGPTGATTAVLDPKIQFWTSRGFAVLDVDYSGSTGYGRPYRDRLKGQWGVVDVEDAVGGAQAMVGMGKADPARLIIRGGSAGGYTTLAALTFFDTFRAGASYYGISDLEVLQHDTHKFEARYNDTLIGPYPEARDVYRARSPIHFTDRLSCPIILFQGLEDKVVPPNQSEMIYDAARKKGLKVKYVTFEGEQHGFRKAENIIRSLEEELAFYQDVFQIS
jgi:dipeptidyl aminopeptidase/acylaminoacyl peptidase